MLLSRTGDGGMSFVPHDRPPLVLRAKRAGVSGLAERFAGLVCVISRDVVSSRDVDSEVMMNLLSD
jgi:hypothetical protein